MLRYLPGTYYIPGRQFYFAATDNTIHRLTMTTNEIHYPDFAYAATELSAYILSLGIFIISLRSGGVVSYTPAHTDDFRQWLSAHGIRDISKDDGIRRTAQS